MLTVLIKVLPKSYKEMVKDPKTMPIWRSKKSRFYFQTADWSNKNSTNYRLIKCLPKTYKLPTYLLMEHSPIKCLSKTYKLLTYLLVVQRYNYQEKNDIFPLEQKRHKRSLYECKILLSLG